MVEGVRVALRAVHKAGNDGDQCLARQKRRAPGRPVERSSHKIFRADRGADVLRPDFARRRKAENDGVIDEVIDEVYRLEPWHGVTVSSQKLTLTECEQSYVEGDVEMTGTSLDGRGNRDVVNMSDGR